MLLAILITVASIVGCFGQAIHNNYEMAMVEQHVLENIRTPILELIEAMLQRKEQYFEQIVSEQMKRLDDLAISVQHMEQTLWQRFLRVLSELMNTSTLNITKECPPTWTPHNYKCYKLVSEKADYDTAQNSCDENGAHLAIPVSEEENNFIVDLLSDDVWIGVWIGVNDRAKENSFVMITTNETVPYSKWGPNEPNDEYGNEDCVELNWQYWKKGDWNDLDCTDMRKYICEHTGLLKIH